MRSQLQRFLMLFVIFAGMGALELYPQSAAPLHIKTSPTEIGDRVVANIVNRYYGWRYQKACTYYGALIFADATGNTTITKQMQEGLQPYMEGKRKPHRGHVDYNVFGIWPFELYRQTGDARYLQMARDLADDEYQEPRPDGLTHLARFWVDDMYMVGSLQVQAYKSTGDKVYLDRAARFLQVYVDTLQRANGLFHHREDAPFYWGRGNGWAVAALTEVLLVLPEDHELHASLLDAFQRMMQTLASFQGEDGMWHQLIDDPDSFPESSSTGMFLYGFISGVDRGWLPLKEYRDPIEKGWEALASYVNEKGEAMNVCIGTNAKNSKKHYLTRPKTNGNFHGQAAVLWASTAMERLLGGSE
ncbi:MAG: glycoside hydrolase family 88/105 protein [Bacteroidales bacterium]